MQIINTLYPLFYFLLFFPLCGTSSSAEDTKWLASLVDLVELDYVDHCEQRASATWSELTGDSKGLSVKLERDKSFGMFSRQQTTDVRSVLTAHALGPDDNVLRRKVKLLLQPGDTLLETDQWIRIPTTPSQWLSKQHFPRPIRIAIIIRDPDIGYTCEFEELPQLTVGTMMCRDDPKLYSPAIAQAELVTFGDTALNKIRFATDYDCDTNTNCTLRELNNNLARQQDEEKQLRMKASWEKNLPNLTDYLEHILPLLRNASKQNNYNSVEEYWDALGEYEGGLLKARELWDHIKPLYLKLHKYVALRMKGAEAVGKPLPVYLLRSLSGDDWSNIIENLLPKHAGIYQKVHANLQLKDLGGMNAFKRAANLIKALNLGEIESETLTDSVYNNTCPTTLVDWCKPNKMKAVTCKDVSIGNYIEAHEAVMKIKYKEIINLHSNNTYILREAPRYSAIYEAIPGFVSLLSLNPHALNRAGLYSLEIFNYNPNYHRLVLQLIMALRDLPKLNFYLAADEWRLKVLMGSIPYAKIPSSWSEFRKNFSLIESSNTDFLGDPYIVFNKPYLGKFMGLILKYQIYQSFAEELMSDESDLINHVADNNERLIDTMIQGYGSNWLEMVSDLLAKRENGLEDTGLTDYYRLLDEYLDNQLEPSIENDLSEDYIEPPIVETAPENEIPTFEDVPASKERENVLTHEDIINNTIDTGGEPYSKFGIETSTVGVLEIKNPVAAEDHKEGSTKEASYNTYWWIGIGVALAVVVILVAIIARKRHSHRKQLERQRRETTRA